MDDLLQEGLIIASDTERTYDKTNRSKYSTYLTTALVWEMRNRIVTPLDQKKRQVTEAVDVKNLSPSEQLKIGCIPLAESNYAAAEAFSNLCLAVSTPARRVLLAGLVQGQRMRLCKKADIIREIQHVVDRQAVSVEDLQLVVRNGDVKTMALTLLGQRGVMVLGIEADAEVIRCVECSRLFSLTDIRKFRFIATTMTCAGCYRRMKEDPPDVNCFGKSKTQTQEGYSTEDAECRIHCSDKSICNTEAVDKTKGDNMKNADAQAALDGVDLGDVQVPKAAKKKAASKSDGKPSGLAHKHSAKSAKSAKKAAPAKKAAVAKSDSVRSGSKTAKLLALLQRPKGVSRIEMGKVSAWNDHSVRGFLSGLERRYGIKLKVIKTEGETTMYQATGASKIAVKAAPKKK
jgi:hypothetical protein